MGEKMNAYRVSMGKPEGKRPLGRIRRRWEDNLIRSSGKNESPTFLLNDTDRIENENIMRTHRQQADHKILQIKFEGGGELHRQTNSKVMS
jgi:hypothetical protein